jgi:hypothetical protein
MGSRSPKDDARQLGRAIEIVAPKLGRPAARANPRTAIAMSDELVAERPRRTAADRGRLARIGRAWMLALARSRR